jgi:hypothetical protein
MVYVLYATLVLLLGFLIYINIYKIRLVNNARRRGKLPLKGKATMFDVRHLLMEGEKELATQLYCEIFYVTLSKAKKDIEELQRSLKV